MRKKYDTLSSVLIFFSKSRKLMVPCLIMIVVRYPPENTMNVVFPLQNIRLAGRVLFVVLCIIRIPSLSGNI